MVFCGTTGSLSDEHVAPKWLRKALQIRENVQEFSGGTQLGSAETLAIVFHEVCIDCNRTWMEALESKVRPVLQPMLLGARAGTSIILDPTSRRPLPPGQ